ncbi:recombinase family protein [Oceanidesulfovibrio indonesiensis]|uniref:Recombinase family protein n=1 Tax=Oceanidesulfovibrio indonesiensis TaxID=54767 RepID=A0A7M3MHP2_9BACT|nr:recombinase family protein [Oceanidesulfovibrio indonesiensis]TVM18688.1 recombinase family protein [Oceanidesulfovibrio indonesiensis]
MTNTTTHSQREKGTNGQHVGYLRVSTLDQHTGRQLEGITLDRRFEEKASAKDTKRPELKACLEYLRHGDTLHVHSIDRLARNLSDLQKIVDDLTSRGVAVQFHKEKLTFTGQDGSMQKLMFQMMGAFAEFERSLIRERQREGIAIAKARGKYKGRKKALTNEQVEEIKARKDRGESMSKLAREYGVSRTTLYASL